MEDGYGRIDAGRFVELARTWDLVKPQTWFDSPAVFLPTTESPDGEEDDDRSLSARQDDDDQDEGDEPNPSPEVTPSGSYITVDGIKSTFEVTQDMLKDANLERLEHITARVWIDHQRRGDVEVELLSPNGILSVLARTRRFDESTTGFAGWKFMSMKHW